MTLAILRTLIPRKRVVRSAGFEMMDALESRTHFSVVNIGPGRAIKSLSAAPWPSKGQTVQFVLDYSSTPYTLSNRQVNGNLTITAADPKKKPTVKLGASY